VWVLVMGMGGSELIVGAVSRPAHGQNNVHVYRLLKLHITLGKRKSRDVLDRYLNRDVVVHILANLPWHIVSGPSNCNLSNAQDALIWFPRHG
jgi:hypothetical protein